MYRPDRPPHRPQPPFGAPPPHSPPFGLRGPCSVPPPGHLLRGPGLGAPYSESHYLHGSRLRGFMRPHCSNFSIDHSTVITLGGSQQIVPPAETPRPQVPQWSPSPVEHHHPDNSERAGEEFLRCIAANKPLPDYLKGNMAYNLVEAFKSTSELKEAVKSDPQLKKHLTRSKSHSRSRGRSRAKSRGRSKSRARSRSRGRSKSHARGRSRARSKTRAHSRNRNQSQSRDNKNRQRSKSEARSRSQVRRSKSRSTSVEKKHSKDGKRKRSPEQFGGTVNSSDLMGSSLLKGLKMVINSKDLEDRLPALKDAILTIQASDERRSVETKSDKKINEQQNSQDISTSLESDSMLLPHERVGSNFSWLQERSEEDISAQKASELEDEESFLYGTEMVFQIGEHAKQEETSIPQNMSLFSCFDPKQSLQTASSALACLGFDSMQYEKLKFMLSSLDDPSDAGKTTAKTAGQQVGKEPATASFPSDTAMASLSNPKVRNALESLQSLIKATKEKRTEGDGILTSSDKQKAGDREERKRLKQHKIKQMQSLGKELEDLLKMDGLSFMSSVIGFYCQKCGEFIGDLNCLENHAAIHHSSNSSNEAQLEKHPKDCIGHVHPHSTSRNHSQSSERRGSSPSSYRGFQQMWKDEKTHINMHHDNSLRGHRPEQENICLKEEMKKERMLITVSRGLPPPTIRVKEEMEDDHRKLKDDVDSKDSRNAKREKYESSESSNDDKSPKTKHPKKKKKKKEKKKKKKKEKQDKS